MAADKPLQDIFNTVRLPVTDAVISTYTGGYTDSAGLGTTFNGVDYAYYHNCYPSFYTDRAANQYSSQFDTWLVKRQPFNNSGAGVADIGNATIPTANLTTATNNICITNLDDVFVASIFDSTAGLHRIIQYRPSAGTQLQIGTIAGAVTDTTFLTEVIIAGVPNVVVSYVNAAETTSTGTFAASAAGVFVAASLTVISDVDYPGNIANTQTRGAMVQLDGYTCILSKQGGLYNSDINSITSWNALSVIQINAYPDQGVGLVRYKNHIVAFGEDSIEFFNDVGNPAPKSPLQRTDQAFIKFGALSAKGILALDDSLYWWSKSTNGKFGLYRLDGYTPTKISTNREDQMAARMAGFPELYIYQDAGRSHIIMNIACYPRLLVSAANTITLGVTPAREGQPSTTNFPSDPNTLVEGDINFGWLCLDTTTGLFWAVLHSCWNISNFAVFPLCAVYYGAPTSTFTNTAQLILWSYSAPRSVAGIANLGNNLRCVASIPAASAGTSQQRYNDSQLTGITAQAASVPVTAAVQFNVWDFGTEKRKRIHRLKVLQRVVQTDGQVGTTLPYTWVIWNKTDGEFSGFTTAESNTTKISKRAIKHKAEIPRSYLNNLGAARKWYFGIIEKGEWSFQCRGIELDISQGTS